MRESRNEDTTRGFRVEMGLHELISYHHDCDGSWLFMVSKYCIFLEHLEDSVIFRSHTILSYCIQYARVSVERPAVGSETKRFALSVE